MDGVCRGSLCIKHGFEECSLRHEEYPDTSTLCNLACFNKEGTCVSILELGVSNLPSALKLRPGTPCDDFRVCRFHLLITFVENRFGTFSNLHRDIAMSFKNVDVWMRMVPFDV